MVDLINKEISACYVMKETIPEFEKSLSKVVNSEEFKNTSNYNSIAQFITVELQKHDKHFAIKWTDPKLQAKLQAGGDWFSKLERQTPDLIVWRF